MSLDGPTAGVGVVSLMGRPATSAASWMLTPLETSCPNTRPSRRCQRPQVVEVEGKVRNTNGIAHLLGDLLSDGDHSQRQEPPKVFLFAVPSEVLITVVGTPAAARIESSARDRSSTIGNGGDMPMRLLTQSSAGFDSMPWPHAASLATDGTRLRPPREPRRSVVSWPACLGSGTGTTWALGVPASCARAVSISMTMLWVSPCRIKRPYAQPGRMVRLCIHQVHYPGRESRLVTDLDGPAKVAAYDQVEGSVPPVTTQD